MAALDVTQHKLDDKSKAALDAEAQLQHNQVQSQPFELLRFGSAAGWLGELGLFNVFQVEFSPPIAYTDVCCTPPVTGWLQGAVDLTRSRAETEAAELQERLAAQGAAMDALQAELEAARAQAQDVDHVSGG